jgi:UDP-N-acetylmuramoyl-tripeptide--D-alanyl-D-alanine ligase
MMRAQLNQIAQWLSVAAPDRDSTRMAQGVSTDTRTLQPGNLFVALKGARFDGYDHLAQAQAQGAVAAVVSQMNPACLLPQIVVPDTLAALQTLGARWRDAVNPCVIAITGSAGKTTVKQLLAALFAERGITRATQGNLNNEIGVPLTLLALEPTDQFAVIELGANHVGEIARLTALVRPDFALVTMAGSAHVGEFGSVDAIVQGKGEIYTGLAPTAHGIINLDSYGSAVWQAQCAAPWQGFSLNNAGKAPTAARWQGVYHPQTDCLTVSEAGLPLLANLKLPMQGAHNATNLLAAISVARAAGLSIIEIEQGLRHFAPPLGRMSVHQINSQLTLIDDTYNANPESMQAAIDYLEKQSGLKFAVLGDMGELGDKEATLHQAVLQHACTLSITGVLTLGQAMGAAVGSLVLEHCAPSLSAYQTPYELADALVNIIALSAAAVPPQPLTILFKGSRFMQMERVMAQIQPSVFIKDAH